MRLCSRCKKTKPATAFSKHGWCRECLREYSQKRWQNPEIRARQKKLNAEWRARNPDYQRQEARQASKRLHANSHREEIRAYNARWHAANREKRRADIALWHKAHPGYRAEYDRSHQKQRNATEARRRARKCKAPSIPFTAKQLEDRLSMYGGRCWICRCVAVAIDHVKPLAKSGAHTLSNLRPICNRCNATKNDRWPYPKRKVA